MSYKYCLINLWCETLIFINSCYVQTALKFSMCNETFRIYLWSTRSYASCKEPSDWRKVGSVYGSLTNQGSWFRSSSCDNHIKLTYLVMMAMSLFWQAFWSRFYLCALDTLYTCLIFVQIVKCLIPWYISHGHWIFRLVVSAYI